jgi:hypothetical protein
MKRIILKIILVLVVLAVLAAGFFYFKFKPTENPGWGVTFSRPQAEYLGFDWKTMYLDMLNDLQPKKLRLVAYWETMETQPDLWYFQDVDEMLAEADKRGIDVTLAIGLKVPRWPECHYPAWYKDLNSDEQTAAHLHMVDMAVNHFKAHSSIKTWQIENEALFNFGDDCPKIEPDTIKKELEIVRAADSRPILMSDSGELGRWIPTAKLGPDILGSTMYRVVHNPKYGYFQYPLPPAFFRIKAGLTEAFTGVKEFRGVELQAEPWFDTDVYRMDLDTQKNLMNPKIFAANVAYAKKVGFEDNYLWGVEWWYWMAQKNNDWGMWEEARTVLQQ